MDFGSLSMRQRSSIEKLSLVTDMHFLHLLPIIFVLLPELHYPVPESHNRCVEVTRKSLVVVLCLEVECEFNHWFLFLFVFHDS